MGNLSKVRRVVLSCRTQAQLDTAMRYVALYVKHLSSYQHDLVAPALSRTILLSQYRIRYVHGPQTQESLAGLWRRNSSDENR